MSQTLLVELSTEELPPKSLYKLGKSFCYSIFHSLESKTFLSKNAFYSCHITPRRLAIMINGVEKKSKKKEIRKKILPVSLSLDRDNKPSELLKKKLLATAKEIGIKKITFSELEKDNNEKSNFFYFTQKIEGENLAKSLQKILKETLTKLPIAKMMNYQCPSGETVQFVRPAQSLIALLDDQVIPINILGLNSDRYTTGHRIMTNEKLISIAHAKDYSKIMLEKGKVITNFEERKEKIRTELLNKSENNDVSIPEDLLNEVTALVEWPAVYLCKFDDKFLSLPQECLVLTMQVNQKYFVIFDKNKKLMPYFLVVSNLDTKNPKNIINGNEKVVKPRLYDAKFFFENDKKKKLFDRGAELSKVLYHNKLGSHKDRVLRITNLSKIFSKKYNLNNIHLERAANLCKNDLVSEMVFEFPELQGIMGFHYALHNKEKIEVAKAILEHYKPRFSGDSLPETPTGIILAIADKMEIVTGIWGIGLKPTGDKDPFGLRRSTIGVLRILIERKLPISVSFLIEEAIKQFSNIKNFKNYSEDIKYFFYDKLHIILRDYGYSLDLIDSTISQYPDDISTILNKVEAVKNFMLDPNSKLLILSNKRISNILRKNHFEVKKIRENLLIEEAEKKLYETLNEIKPNIKKNYLVGDFKKVLELYKKLIKMIDDFFNDVLVMSDNKEIKENRLALLKDLHDNLNIFVDFSKINI